jgi:hypothetical protein
MQEQIEDTSHIPTSRPNYVHSLRNTLITVITTILILAALAGVGTYFYKRHVDALPFPKVDIKSVSFPFYYPSELPPGYKPLKNSFSLQNGGVVFYSLTNGNARIKVSEQAVPEAPPDLAHIYGFKKVTTANGNDVAVGTTNSQPTALLLADTTLITVTGLKGVPKDTVFQTAQSMNILSIN